MDGLINGFMHALSDVSQFRVAHVIYLCIHHVFHGASLYLREGQSNEGWNDDAPDSHSHNFCAEFHVLNHFFLLFELKSKMTFNAFIVVYLFERADTTLHSFDRSMPASFVGSGALGNSCPFRVVCFQ